ADSLAAAHNGSGATPPAGAKSVPPAPAYYAGKAAAPAQKGAGGSRAAAQLDEKQAVSPPSAAPPAATDKREPARAVSQMAPAMAQKPAAAEEATQRLAMKKASSEATTPAQIEAQAQQARHGGNYPLAAAMYRKAAALHRADPAPADQSIGAWDLAHAVECLAAAGLFDEARQVRAELMQFYPSENTPLRAADRV